MTLTNHPILESAIIIHILQPKLTRPYDVISEAYEVATLLSLIHDLI